MESPGQIPSLSDVPEGVHIRDVEDQPFPASHGFTLFQIEDRRLSVSCAQGRELHAFSTVEKLYAPGHLCKTAETAPCSQPEK